MTPNRNICAQNLPLLRMACCVPFLVKGMVALGFSTERDSVVVDGARLDYVAEVNIDTTTQASATVSREWWFGAGWDIRANSTPPSVASMSTHALATNRPLLVVEHQRRRRGDLGKVGAFLVYSQPWALSLNEVSDHVKGWIPSADPTAASPAQQVVLRPDDLAFERDTLLAPLRLGHAIRFGVCWEGREAQGWWPRATLSADVLRPSGWLLMPPEDPATWPLVESADTYEPLPWASARFRLELGAVVDLGKSIPQSRSAGQLRATLFMLPGAAWGASLSFVASPTRR